MIHSSSMMASPRTSHDANNNQDEQINDILSLMLLKIASRFVVGLTNLIQQKTGS